MLQFAETKYIDSHLSLAFSLLPTKTSRTSQDKCSWGQDGQAHPPRDPHIIGALTSSSPPTPTPATWTLSIKLNTGCRFPHKVNKVISHWLPYGAGGGTVTSSQEPTPWTCNQIFVPMSFRSRWLGRPLRVWYVTGSNSISCVSLILSL